jgi:lysophospholipase L1-like esterase
VPIEDFQANIGAMIERAEKQGAKVVLAPLAQEWDAGRWSAVGLPQPAPGEALPWTPYREALVGLARQYGVIHVPFYEHFSRSQMPAARLFSDPIHPTPDGAKIMARALFSAIESSPELLGLEGGE